MAAQVRPPGSPPRPSESEKIPSHDTDVHQKLQSEMPVKQFPQQSTYIIHIPKDQVYRIPPTENTARFEQYTRRKSSRSPCCCCCCWFFAFLLSSILLLAITCGVLYLVFKPKSLKYTVDRISVRHFNLTSPARHISPEFDVTFRADNSNKKIGIYYEIGSFVNVFYNAVRLCDGVLPAFYQPSNNITSLKTALTGSRVELSNRDRKALVDDQKKGRVPLKVNLRTPVKIKVASVKTWEIAVKVNCDITVDKLTRDAKLVSKRCDYKVEIW